MKFRYIIPALFILLLWNGRAAAQAIIDEDFLDNIENNARQLWDEGGPAFAPAITGDAYKKASAVIIGFKRSVTIDKKSRAGFLSRGERSLIFYENVRFKIKLNDRNAVKSFTEVYFRYSDKTDGFSAKLFKHDGGTTPVLLNDAVSVESVSDVPEFFKSFFDQQSGYEQRYYKVAVPNLEPGDILEYVAITKSKLNVMGTGYIEFSPQYELCSKKYPILHNQIIIETDDKSYFKSLSLNGAPQFKKETASDPEFFRYTFTDQTRDVEKDVNFIKTYQVYPLVKFQVIYSNKEKVKGALIGQTGEIKSSFTKEELARKAWEDYEQTGDAAYSQFMTVQRLADLLWAELKKLGAKDWSEKEYVMKAFYRLRNLVVNRDTYLSDKVAAFVFGSLLYQRDINSELIISISNNTGKMSDILFDQEIRYAIKVGDALYFNPTDHSNYTDLVEDLLGSEAWIIAKPTKTGQDIKTITLPNADATANTGDFAISVTLKPDMNTLAVTRTSTFTGISKNRNSTSALRYTTYMLDDYKSYGGDPPTDKMRGSQEADYNESVAALKKEFAEAKKEYVKSELQKEFQQKVTHKGFKILNDGRSVKAPALKFTEEFELPGMVRKAGKKLLVNIPGLVGSQLQIKNEERSRTYDINVGYARSFTWTISFKIPDGYTAEGIRELNTNVDNETGTYNCLAKEENGQVVVTVKKVYKKADYPKSSWTSMLAFVDAAYNQSFKYILLKPKS